MSRKSNEPLVFSQQEKEFIDGAMLGDGHITKPRGRSCQFSYVTSKQSHAEYVYQKLKRMSVGECNEGPIKKMTYDIRTQKTYTSYRFRSIGNITFFEWRQRWYPEGKKIIPPDVNLTPISTLIWYLGDGELRKPGRSQYIKLSTHSFEKIQLETFVIPKMFQFDPHLVKCDKEGQFYIYIPRYKVPSFLSWIGECPVVDYSHKWDILPYKYPNVAARGRMLNYSNYDEIVKEWITETYSIYGLSKKFNIPIGCIKRELTKRNINWHPMNNKKPIVQYDLLDNPVRTWYSGQQIKQELGYNAGAISRCCHGTKKQYKGYKWKFETLSATV